MTAKPLRWRIGTLVVATIALTATAGSTFIEARAQLYQQGGQNAAPSAQGGPEPVPSAAIPPIRSLVREVSIDPPRFDTVEAVNTMTGERMTMHEMKVTVHNRTPVGIRWITFGWGDTGHSAGENKPGSPNVIEPFGEYEFTFVADGFEAGDVLELRAVAFADGATSGSKVTIRSGSPDAGAARQARPLLDGRCPRGGAYANGCCRDPSAIVLDLDGDGVSLTDVESGVLFDMSGDGTADRTPWTEADSDDAWLCLDRNDNGVIDDATELFGAITPQPATKDTNGFLALKALDTNRDGRLTVLDSGYKSLRLWADANHDGVSQPDELSGLASKGIAEIGLSFEEHQKFDASENCHRLRADVIVERNEQPRILAWEVILTMDYGWGESKPAHQGLTHQNRAR